MRKALLYAFLLGSLTIWAEAPQRVRMEDEREFNQVSEMPRRATIHRAVADVGVRKMIPRIPVIMVQFSDFSFSRTREQVDSMFNAQHYAQTYRYNQGGNIGIQTITTPGSIRQYFYDQSMGQYNPQFDIYGPITISESCCAGFSDYTRVRTMVKEACTLVDDSCNFSQYDADNDGKIDLVYIYFAGFGQNDAAYIADGLVSNKNQLIWPHWSTTSGASYDGKQIRDYECANELDGYWTQSLSHIYPAGIGVAVHEFCHALGLPDLYPTNGNTNAFRHLGSYDVMDYAPYNDEMHSPCSLSAYERWFLGWLTPTLLNNAQTVTLDYIGTTNQACLVTEDGQPLSAAHASTAPYYLIENRQKHKWDAGTIQGYDLLGHGMMITRIEYSSSAWSGNAVNPTASNQHVKLICADGDYTYSRPQWYGKATDLFPAGATFYNNITGYPITNIREDENGVIHFDFMGGSTPTQHQTTESIPTVQKKLSNGRIIVVREGKTYDLLGYETRQL